MHLLAYIDPGFGSLIWQSVIGAFVGLFFYVRKTRQWIGRMLGKMLRIPVKHETPVDVRADKS
jgi:hypothetical protein